MAASIEVNNEYGYVVLVLVAYAVLNFWMSFQVGKARRKYKVFYPTMYAVESENKDAKLFNCVQVCFVFVRPALRCPVRPILIEFPVYFPACLTACESREGTRTRWR